MEKTKELNTFLITGATGFLGNMIAKKIADTYTNIRFIFIVRDKNIARKMYSIDFSDKNIEIIYIESNLEEMDIQEIQYDIDYIIHCAAITDSKKMVTYPVEVADGIVIGTKKVLQLAKEKQIKSMVYISSMEVYGRIKADDELISEECLGDILINSERSCYSLGKRIAEHYCYIYFKEYDIPVKTARLAQTFGKGVAKKDNRVYAQFARAVIDNRDIVLHTDGMSMGNYCASEDVVEGILTILYKGKNGESYNVVNENNTMTIREMAETVAEKIAKGRIKVVFDIDNSKNYGYAPNTGLRLSSKKLCELGWKPTKNVEEMYRDLIEEFTKK
ncbi:MAG: NAD(P)-dependent oxidoreductase [Lachnospiraceae bacterium]|nr:NAD(P)-dependent oxidoreductase [Lachnospiraceae bacterium]